MQIILQRQLDLDAYAAASAADAIRRELMRRQESFIFETVFSDPVGEKVGFLEEMESGIHCGALLQSVSLAAEISEVRVSMRVSKGGHDVPSDKLATRYPRTMENLKLAMTTLSEVWVYDNDDLANPYRLVRAM